MTFIRNHSVGSSTAAGTTVVTANDYVVPPGRLLVMRVTANNLTATTPTVSSITRAAGETATWTRLASHGSSSATAAAGVIGEIWGLITTVEWPLIAITVTLSGSVVAKAVTLQEFDGTTKILRGTAGAGTSIAGTPTASTGGAALEAGDLVLGLGSFENNAAPIGDADTTNGAWSAIRTVYTASGGAAANVASGGQHKIVTAAGVQTYNPTGASDSGSCVVALQPAIMLTADSAMTVDATSGPPAVIGVDGIGATITLPGGAFRLAISPDGELWVGTQPVQVIRTSDNTVVGTVDSYYDITLFPLNDPAYAYFDGGNQISRVRRSDKVVEQSANITSRSNSQGGADVTPDGAYIYAGTYSGQTVKVIRTSDLYTTATLSVYATTNNVAVRPDGAYAYVACQQNVQVIRTSDNAVMPAVSTPNASGLVVSPDSAYVYVHAYGNDCVYVIRTSDHTVVATIAGVTNPYDIKISPDGEFVYTANYDSSCLTKIRTSDNTIVGTIPMPVAPYRIAMSPEGSIYAATMSNQIPVFTTKLGLTAGSTMTVAATVIPPGGEPAAAPFIGWGVPL